MEINNIKSTTKNISKKPGADKNKLSPKQLGYSPPPSPDDSYSPGEDKKNFVERAIDGISRFVKKNIVGPTEKFAHKLRNDFGTQAVTAGTMVGGATGAYLGYEAARMEISNARSASLQWQEPVMVDKNLGNIPRSHYQWTFGIPFWSDSNRFEYDANGNLIDASYGVKPVYRSGPVINSDGSLEMKTVERTLNSQRFGIFGGVMGGLAIGAIGGSLAGLAVSLINKIVRDK